MPSWQSTSRIGCPIDNPARRSRGAAPSTRPQWTRVPLDFRPRWRYVVNKAGAANAAPALKYKFYFTPHFCGYTEFGIVPVFLSLNGLLFILCEREKFYYFLFDSFAHLHASSGTVISAAGRLSCHAAFSARMGPRCDRFRVCSSGISGNPVRRNHFTWTGNADRAAV